jgi:alpha-amylase
MYARMMQISGRLAEVSANEHDPAAHELLDRARTELYRAQCNCSYWHGAFGGIYLPHLRNAVYRHLILADTLLEQATARGDASWCEITEADFDFDGNREIQLASDRLVAFVDPVAGGRLYELDVRDISHNLLATLARRPEAYHEKVLAGPSTNGDDVASIHDRVVFKQEGLDKLLRYDNDLRKSLVDRFYYPDASLDDVVAGHAEQIGEFEQHPYEASTDVRDGRAEVVLRREGRVADQMITITKRLALSAGNSLLDVTYLVEGLASDRPLHFAVEWNFAGLPDGADDRYFYDADHQRLGQLGSHLDLHEVTGVGLVDEWLGIDIGLAANRPTSFWTYPLATVSQSEGGFEAVHQSVVVMPHWLIQGDQQGRWGASLQLSIDTSRAAGQQSQETVVAAVP